MSIEDMKKILFSLSMVFVPLLVCGYPEDSRGVPTYSHGYTLEDQYLMYEGPSNTDVTIPYNRGREIIYTWKESEEINGKTYIIVYDAFVHGSYEIFKLHMRREGSQIRVIYDEYKRFMHETRGRDMTGFDSQCPYEVTNEGEMILYDFDMQPGDKFLPVNGKDEVYVVKKEKMNSVVLTDLDHPQGLLLSNGIFILENVGAAYYEGSYSDCVDIDFFDYVQPVKGVRTRQLWHAQLGAKRVFDNHSDVDNGYTGITESHFRIGSKDESPIHSLSGQRLQATPQRGIYVKNRKKFIIR